MLTVAGASIPVTKTGSACTAFASGAPELFRIGRHGISEHHDQLNMYLERLQRRSLDSSVVSIRERARDRRCAVSRRGQSGLVPRTGYILIADQTLTITQATGPAGSVSGFTLSTFAGGGSASTPANGDGRPATQAYFNHLLGLARDSATGTLFVLDYRNSGPLLRAITPDGNINAVGWRLRDRRKHPSDFSGSE